MTQNLILGRGLPELMWTNHRFMSVLGSAVTIMASRVVCRDQLKLRVQRGKEKEGELQVELDRLCKELDRLRGELDAAEENLQKIGTVMASLRNVCESPDRHDGNLDGTGKDNWKLNDIIAQTEGVLEQRSWSTLFKPLSESRSTLSSTDSNNSGR